MPEEYANAIGFVFDKYIKEKATIIQFLVFRSLASHKYIGY